MKVLILAAGQGTRLRPYTNDKPKCMVTLYGKPLIHHQLSVMTKCGISRDNIGVIGGYLKDKIDLQGANEFVNKEYRSTNMVHTLFCGEDFINDDEDLIISYGDIIYEERILKSLIDSAGDVVLAADKNWHDLWSLRMDNPLDDAETFKISEANTLSDIGKVPRSFSEVDAQYMGLIKISAKKIKQFKSFYYGLDRTKKYDGQDFSNMYMTSLIQSLIDAGWCITPLLVQNGWLEVDTAEELELYEELNLVKL